MKNIVWANIDEVKPYEKNPRKNDQAVDLVANSLKEFGWKQPIVVDKDYVIIAGHTRLKAAKKLKMEKVPVIVADDLNEQQVKAYRLADNKVAEASEWDDEMLLDELNDIFDFDMGDFGFDFFEDESQEIKKDEVPEVDEEKEPTTKLGDIWQLGRHRLMCGDSTSLGDVNSLVGGAQIDLFITDPPYNVDYTGKTKEALKIQNDKMEADAFREFLKDAFESANSVMKPGAVFYIWHADTEGYNFRGACKDVGWKIRECLIWNKNTMVMGRQDYHWKHEPCLYGWKEGTHLWASDRKQTTILNFDRPIKSDMHPTMKPVALFDYQIKNNTKKGDIVLDTFSGSGTTIIACEQNGRIAYCMELDPKYCDVIVRRWENLTGEKAVLLNE